MPAVKVPGAILLGGDQSDLSLNPRATDTECGMAQVYYAERTAVGSLLYHLSRSRGGAWGRA